MMQSIIDWHNEFRSVLFLSNITLGTFLFTMKSFIIQTMKKEVYDNEEYQKKISQRIREGYKQRYYSSLSNLSRLIFWAILLAFISAIIQITVGYFKLFWAAVISIAIACLSWGVVLIALLLISDNLVRMIQISEEAAEKKHR